MYLVVSVGGFLVKCIDQYVVIDFDGLLQKNRFHLNQNSSSVRGWSLLS